MNSYYIYKLLQLLRCAGWTVDTVADLPRDVAGRTHYDRHHVELNCASAEAALLTLAHECGHVVDYNRRWNRPPELRRPATRATRERLAYAYGWAVLRHVGAPITRAAWRAAHPELFEGTPDASRAENVRQLSSCAG